MKYELSSQRATGHAPAWGYAAAPVGSGAEATEGADVVVSYRGTLDDGSVFDAAKSFTFTLGARDVIKGWDMGVATMRKGEKAELFCRADYAYGETGSPPKIPGGATLKFEVELLSWAEPK